jgi:stage II sporulation protein AA (anti-sigma F factor antagonist)
MDVWFSATQRTAVVALTGELDLARADALRHALLRAQDAHALVVVDLAAVTFLDSTVVGVLVAAARRCREAGLQLVVAHAQGMPRKVLGVLGATFLLAPSQARRDVALRAEAALTGPEGP